MDLDLKREPFSRFGTWLSIAWQGERYSGSQGGKSPNGAGWYLRSHHARAVIRRELFLIELWDGSGWVTPEGEASPEEMTLRCAAGSVSFCFTPEGNMRIHGTGTRMRLRIPVNGLSVAYRDGEGLLCVNARAATRRYQFERLDGELELDAPWGEYVCEHIQVLCAPGPGGSFEVAVDEFWSTWVRPASRPSYEAVRDTAAEDFARFADAHGSAPRDPGMADAWTRALYVNWASTVPAGGQLERPTMFMSKHWMDQVWSWDNCFNAMSLAGADDVLAWDQWLVVFDHQDEFGAIPDGLNDVFKHYNFCKPPVHGWAARHLLQAGATRPDAGMLRRIYDHLSRHTNWFLTHRQHPVHPLPYYLHGNDSGWDNSSMFDAGVPLIAPDLAALLVVQAEVLSELATELGDAEASRRWFALRDRLLKDLITLLWDGNSFVAQRIDADGNLHPVNCQSLIPYIPIFLGARLPEHIHRALASGLERFVTDWGVATENPNSPQYEANGYWRGPVWAPSTMIVVSGLVDAGYTDLACRIAKGFCRSCVKSGFAENYDALTGDGLCDRAYSWTASVFLMLARQFGESE